MGTYKTLSVNTVVVGHMHNYILSIDDALPDHITVAHTEELFYSLEF